MCLFWNVMVGITVEVLWACDLLNLTVKTPPIQVSTQGQKFKVGDFVSFTGNTPGGRAFNIPDGGLVQIVRFPRTEGLSHRVTVKYEGAEHFVFWSQLKELVPVHVDPKARSWMLATNKTLKLQLSQEDPSDTVMLKQWREKRWSEERENSCFALLLSRFTVENALFCECKDKIIYICNQTRIHPQYFWCHFSHTIPIAKRLFSMQTISCPKHSFQFHAEWKWCVWGDRGLHRQGSQVNRAVL